MWVFKGREFYNNSSKKWLRNNDNVMHSIHNEEKSVVEEKAVDFVICQNTRMDMRLCYQVEV